MTNYPEMVAGEGRLCTDLMEHTAGRLFAKAGAEGLYCVGVPGAELGVVLKVEDGSGRAVAPAVLAVPETAPSVAAITTSSERIFGIAHSLRWLTNRPAMWRTATRRRCGPTWSRRSCDAAAG